MDGQTLAAAIALSRGSGGGSFAPDINDPQDGDTLVYDASEQKWVNGSGGGGSGGGFLKVGVDMETGTLDKTWKEISDALNAGYFVSIITNSDSGVDMGVIYNASNSGRDGYVITVYNYSHNETTNFFASEENDYPQA